MSLFRKIIIVFLLFTSAQINAQLMRQIVTVGEVGKIDEEMVYVDEKTERIFMFNKINKTISVSRDRARKIFYTIDSEEDDKFVAYNDNGEGRVFVITDLTIEMYWVVNEKVYQINTAITYDSLKK
jgi:hypothetical protein